MATLLRTAKSASDWTVYDLRAYNIKVSLFPDPQIFYGKSYPTVGSLTSSSSTSNIDPDLFFCTLSMIGLRRETRRLLLYLDLSSRTNSDQELAVHDFVKEILRALGYQDVDSLLRTRYTIPLSINGDPNRSAQIAVGLVHGPSSLIVMLVVQTMINPDPQVIASAIAAFQYNNSIRTRLGKPELGSATIPCIAMIGTRPIFYTVNVTEELSEAVLAGQYPASHTVVNKCIVAPSNTRLSEGTESPEFRQVAIQHFVAFRSLAWDYWNNSTGKNF